MTSALAIENIEVVYNHSVQALRGMSIEVPEGKIVALAGLQRCRQDDDAEGGVGRAGRIEKGRVAAGPDLRSSATTSRAAPAYQLARAGPGPRARGPAHLRRPDGGREPGRRGQRADRPAAGWPWTSTQVFDLLPAPARTAQADWRATSRAASSRCWPSAAPSSASPRLILLDEPSLGLAPLVVKDIFAIIERINREQGVAMLLVEQNAHVALSVAHEWLHHGERPHRHQRPHRQTARTTPTCSASTSARATKGEGHVSFRDVKHYKRRKRWLS